MAAIAPHWRAPAANYGFVWRPCSDALQARAQAMWAHVRSMESASRIEAMDRLACGRRGPRTSWGALVPTGCWRCACAANSVRVQLQACHSVTGVADRGRGCVQGGNRDYDRQCETPTSPVGPCPPDMAELKAASRRWMYSGGRPNPVAGVMARATATLAGVGLSPRRLVTLEVRGRRSGRLISFPVVVADYQGERYLVAMLGRSAHWIRNVQAAGGAAVIRHGRREAVNLEPVEPDARAPILRRYLELAPGARAHIPVDRRAALDEFEQIAADYPVFRVTHRPQSGEDREPAT
jgi:deazaflavin-dependent oxidoreductase (nitroreductase family)